MNKIYLELDEKKAKFFEYSKNQKEGFEKYESSNGKISYRKYYNDGVIGVLKFINEREDELTNGGKVKKLSLVLDNQNTRQYLGMHILTAKGNMGQFVEQLIPFLPNLKKDEAYRVYPYEMEVLYTDTNGKDKIAVNKGVSIYTYDIENNVKLVKVERAHSFGKEGDIPDVIWEKEEDMGVIKNIKNDKERRNYLYNILKKSLSSQETSTKQTESQPPKNDSEKPKVNDEEYDDLPF